MSNTAIYPQSRSSKTKEVKKAATLLFVAITVYSVYYTLINLGAILWYLSTPIVNIMK